MTGTFASEMTWEIVGHSEASRCYANKEEFIDEVLAPFGWRFSTTDPFRPVTVRRIQVVCANHTPARRVQTEQLPRRRDRPTRDYTDVTGWTSSRRLYENCF